MASVLLLLQQHPLSSYTTTTIYPAGESLGFDDDAGDSAYHTTRSSESLVESGIILVRDPPRERLGGTRCSEENLERVPSLLVSVSFSFS
ncbi:hypothetical protein M413DRAFT_445798 [Hebeloma cylindrosporum]|uniref:Uncharacterized protein n=1 Tax=Hebeloma cylindrosporum TaxID=76867 RepID=A0A0C3BWR8_HEBCY|nr:hypothetical protein M413DRAFT_445798 [Hebeloma cylindrosporum h7]